MYSLDPRRREKSSKSRERRKSTKFGKSEKSQKNRKRKKSSKERKRSKFKKAKNSGDWTKTGKGDRSSKVKKKQKKLQKLETDEDLQRLETDEDLQQLETDEDLQRLETVEIQRKSEQKNRLILTGTTKVRKSKPTLKILNPARISQQFSAPHSQSYPCSSHEQENYLPDNQQLHILEQEELDRLSKIRKERNFQIHELPKYSQIKRSVNLTRPKLFQAEPSKYNLDLSELEEEQLKISRRLHKNTYS